MSGNPSRPQQPIARNPTGFTMRVVILWEGGGVGHHGLIRGPFDIIKNSYLRVN